MSPSSRKLCLAAGGLVALTVAAYVPSVSGGFVWDDYSYIVQNRAVTDDAGLKTIWSHLSLNGYPNYPLTSTSFWLECRLWGLRPVGYHLVNVLLHAVNAVLLWLVLRRLGVPGAWVAAAVFTVHPVQVESVAWVTERKNVLSCTFYLLAGLAYFRFSPPRPTPAEDARPWKYYALATGLFVCALLSKTVTATLPAALLLVLWWRRGRVGWRDVWPLLPLLVIAVTLGLITAWTERHHAGAQGALLELSFVERCLIAGRAVWFYVSKVVWPAGLMSTYPRWHVDAGVWWHYLYPVSAVCVVTALWVLRRHIGRGPATAVLFFGGSLLPTLGFLNFSFMAFSFVADRFLYLPGIGMITFIVSLAAALFRRHGETARHFGVLTALVCITVLGALARHREGVYRTPETFWRDAVAKNPESYVAHGNLGGLLMLRRDTTAAVMHLQRAVEIRPDYLDALNNLGTILAMQRKYPEAIARFREILHVDPENAAAHFNLAGLLAAQGDLDDAQRQYREALRRSPESPHVLNAFAWMLATCKDAEHRDGKESLRLAERACELTDYHDPQVLDTLAAAYAETGAFEKAVTTAQEGIRLAREGGQQSLAAGIEMRLRYYRNKRPWHTGDKP